MMKKEIKKIQTKVRNRFIKMAAKYPFIIKEFDETSLLNIIYNKDIQYIHNENSIQSLSNIKVRGAYKPISYSLDYEDDLDFYRTNDGDILDLLNVYINMGLNDSDNVIEYATSLIKTGEYSNIYMAVIALNKLKFKR